MGAKLTITQFIYKAQKVHGNYYDYSFVDYHGAKISIIILCVKHGKFKQKPNDHLNGNGCVECARERLGNERRKSVDKFIEQSQKVHGNFYDYSKTEYKNNDGRVTIICPTHGEFSQIANVHRRGGGCPICYCDLSVEFFIKKSNFVHNNKYDYSKITQKQVGSEDIVEITCSKHGVFKQRKRAHWGGQGCPNCKSSISKKQVAWIKSLNVDIFAPYKLPDIKISVDGYDPLTKTVYEFDGDFWHGNPDVFDAVDKHPVIPEVTFGDLYNKTIVRNKKIEQAGYRLITIWEHDWDELQKTTSRVSKNASSFLSP